MPRPLPSAALSIVRTFGPPDQSAWRLALYVESRSKSMAPAPSGIILITHIKHGPNCGHTAVRHHDHVDYLHDGHLHHTHEDHIDEHLIEVSDTNPVRCTLETQCSHTHGPGCGHEQVPHGDHIDYLVDGRLHHPHDCHCDDHGPVAFG